MYKKNEEKEFSLKDYFVPFTTIKAIHFIVIVGFIVYGNMLFNGFVWDDLPFILNNPQVHKIDLQLLVSNNMFNNGSFYRPIPAVYFATMYTLFGQSAFFYHFMQLLLHLACTVFLFVYLCKFFHNKTAFFLSLVFLVHPINVESVAYIGSTQSELYFLPGIIALLLLSKKDGSLKRYIVISFLLALSVFTKETGFLFVILAIIYEFLFHSRKRIKVLFLSLVVFGIIYVCFRIFLGQVTYAPYVDVPIAALSFSQRLLHIPSILMYYLKTFLFPYKLAIWQDWVITSPSLENFYIPFGICFLVFFLLIGLLLYFMKTDKKQTNVFAFFAGWFLLGIGLLLHVYPLDMTVADRWFYFPIVGILGMLGLIIQNLIKNKKANGILLIVGVVIIVSYSLRTIVRNTNYYDEITLFNHDIQIEKGNNLELALGVAHLKSKNFKEGITHLQNSIDSHPTAEAYNNLGFYYEYRGDFHQAKKYYEKAMSLGFKNNPDKHLPAIYANYALFLFRTKDFKKAIKISEQGLKEYPNYTELWEYLAASKYMLRDQEGALGAAEKAKSISENEETIHLYTTILNKGKIPLEVKYINW
jgi:Tfp pilus assembly protein PilF